MAGAVRAGTLVESSLSWVWPLPDHVSNTWQRPEVDTLPLLDTGHLGEAQVIPTSVLDAGNGAVGAKGPKLPLLEGWRQSKEREGLSGRHPF